jgi:hypothetical protein
VRTSAADSPVDAGLAQKLDAPHWADGITKTMAGKAPSELRRALLRNADTKGGFVSFQGGSLHTGAFRFSPSAVLGHTPSLIQNPMSLPLFGLHIGQFLIDEEVHLEFAAAAQS